MTRAGRTVALIVLGGLLAGGAATVRASPDVEALRDEIYYRLVEPCLPSLARHMYESDDLPMGIGMMIGMAIEMFLEKGVEKMTNMSEPDRMAHYADAVAQCQRELRESERRK